MRRRTRFLLCLLAMSLTGTAKAQQAKSPSGAPPEKAPAKKSPPAAPRKPKPDDATPEAQDTASDADAELQVAVRAAGNDSAALVKSLEAYLSKYPDSPRRAAIYRALLEAEMQQHNQRSALDYAEKVIALQPEDSQSMFAAVTLLEKLPDDASQLRAIDYDTRLLERVGKANPESRPQQMTLDDWQTGRNKFMVDLYVLRGRLEHHLHKNDEATKDLLAGSRLLPNAEAALTLGEIAEEERRSDEAIRQYATAFMLADQEQPTDTDDPPMDREALRLRMGNLWRFTHDSNAGLGDVLLSAYDKSREMAEAEKPNAPAAYNKDVSDPLQFSMRHLDASGAAKLSEFHGKVVVLNFWTTWCAYCNKMESMLADVRTKFSSRDDVVFLAVNADEEESLVAPFLQGQKPGGTLVFADGIDRAFHVETIPTIAVLDKAGKIVYRTQGFAPDGFADLAVAAITKASAAPAP